ncbi:hypothetical protein [Halomonas sp. BM-2019]|uniref:hypothetical protein n=1 Tax=Halomonas sp. BM-2019 TaxID=2811227 RepID=UPI001B3C25E3|nr:MAG: hypothetical protein J5F18_09765 [Halomonas sp. BM-2019]
MSDILFQPLGNPPSSRAGIERIADIDPRLTRTHYFDGRLLTAEDLTRDQLYLDQRLREVGRALGSGVVHGLGLRLVDGNLALEPGIAISAAGRVLELGRPLSVDLGDRAKIASLNRGRWSRFNRGLYAVILSYAEIGRDRAEVFPSDLGAKRGSEIALIDEAVQLGLVAMPIPLAEQDPLDIRARLVREFLGGASSLGLVPEDAVALGVLAISHDRPAWLDTALLRHPVRGEPQSGDLQADIARHYEGLLRDVIAARVRDDFAATDHFHLLPPAGRVPFGSVDPISGRQGYFPEDFDVTIAPIRRADVELIRAESMHLPAIDLSLDEPVSVMVLAPLSNADYSHYALRLERSPADEPRALPRIDPLRLKLHPVRPIHRLATDASVWQTIWDRIDPADLFFVRRPTRAAETAISGIVLALGTPTPEDGDAPELPDSPADVGGLVEDEETVFLRRISVARLAALRPPVGTEAEAAREAFAAAHGDDAASVQAALDILLVIGRDYDGLVWQTLAALAGLDRLTDFRDGLDDLGHGDDVAALVIELGTALGLDTALLDQWAALTA